MLIIYWWSARPGLKRRCLSSLELYVTMTAGSIKRVAICRTLHGDFTGVNVNAKRVFSIENLNKNRGEYFKKLLEQFMVVALNEF